MYLLEVSILPLSTILFVRYWNCYDSVVFYVFNLTQVDHFI